MNIPDDGLVLDVGGWAKPLARADWVIDLLPYETRGLYGEATGERFSAATWVQHDICSRDPWPFADDQFDYAVRVYLEAGECPDPVPSTIVDVTGDVPHMLREGAVPLEKLRDVVPNLTGDV